MTYTTPTTQPIVSHIPQYATTQRKKELQEAITGFLIQKIGEGSITDREGVLRALESDLGLSVARITPNAISIKDPTNENGRNIRLKGEIYADTFRFSQEHSTENERASQNYRANRIERIRATGAELTAEIERKRAFNIQRYSEPRKELERANQQDTSLQNSDREHNGLATGDNIRLGIFNLYLAKNITKKQAELAEIQQNIDQSPIQAKALAKVTVMEWKSEKGE